MFFRGFRPGDPVVYTKTKHSPKPGPRAYGIKPSQHGEDYVYRVNKFWRVGQVFEDGRVLLYTRGGKRHICSITDQNLHRPGVFEYLLWHSKFPPVELGEMSHS